MNESLAFLAATPAMTSRAGCEDNSGNCKSNFVHLLNVRQTGQDTAEELRGRDFRKDLEERERQAARERNKEKGSRSTTEQPKRPRLDQPPPSNLDADDPVDDDDEDDSEERYSNSCHNFCILLV